MTTAPARPPVRAPARGPTGPAPQSSPAAGGQAVNLGKLKPNQAMRLVLNAVEGWGKTSAGCFAPGAAILCAAGETGYQTLLGAGLVPEIPGAIIESWPALNATLDDLAKGGGGPQLLILDAAGGFDEMCKRHVVESEFGGDAGPRGFLNFNKGYESTAREWGVMLSRLDRLHRQGVSSLLLVHTTDKTINNPMGADFSKYIGALNQKVWDVIKRWADAVLFGKFETIIDADASSQEQAKKTGRKLKAIGGSDRVLYCEQRDAFDAKNRYGMPPVLDIPNEPSQVWATITSNMRRAG